MEQALIIAAGFVHALMYGNAILNRLHLRRTRLAATPPVRRRLSVLIPARNEAENLPRLLASLRAQTHTDFEVLIYDDQSDDDTWEIVQGAGDERISGLRGGVLPEGWVGKVHACRELGRSATGDIYLFLDADTELLDAEALRRMAGVFEAAPGEGVVTGVTRLSGGGQILVSMVGNLILAGLPWWMGPRTPASVMAGVNGQCWMISSRLYRRLEPHEQVRNQVLEDILIGRYLHRNGVAPRLVDFQKEVAVYMYRDFPDAWRGFRKNASEMMGRTVVGAGVNLLLYVLVFLVAPFAAPIFLLSLYGMKAITDRATHVSIGYTLLAPVSYLLAAVLTLDSIVSRGRGRLTWKGRNVSRLPGRRSGDTSSESAGAP